MKNELLEKIINEIDDEYPSCKRCYSTLCLYHSSALPDSLTGVLEIEPSRVNLARGGGDNGWFYSTRDKVESKDFRRHILFLISEMEKSSGSLKKVKEIGWYGKITCYWESESGNGGPELDTDFMRICSDFGFRIEFDIWF